MMGTTNCPSPAPCTMSPVNGNRLTISSVSMKSPTVKMVTANVGSLPKDKLIAKHPETVESLIKIAGYPDIVFLQETNWTEDSFAIARNKIANMNFKESKKYSLLGSTSHHKGSRGVGLVLSSDITLIRSDTTFPFTELDNRLLRADVQVNGTDALLTVLVVYAPVEKKGTQSAKFYQRLNDYLLEVPCEYPIIACGDWNAIASLSALSPDTLSKGSLEDHNKKLSPHLVKFLSSWDLQDAYDVLRERGIKPNYTTTNKHAATPRRLDQLHVSAAIQFAVRSTRVLEDDYGTNLTNSTHKAICFNLRFGPKTSEQQRGPGTWRMPNWVLEPDYLDWLNYRVSVIIADLAGLPPQVILVHLKNTIKAVISEEARDRSRRRSRLTAVERKNEAIKATASQWHKYPATENLATLKARVHSQRQDMEILALTTPEGDVVKDTPSVCNIVADFYESLYNKVPEVVADLEGDFLDLYPHELRLSDSHQKVLESDFSEEEILETITRVTNPSAPGPDGIPYKFYLVCWEELGELLTAVYNEPVTGEPILRERNTSIIRLIYKSGNRSDISNYRPIALMNTEVKIYTHLINGRLRPHLGHLMHESQCGFVPGRLLSDNLDVMDHFYHAYSDLEKGWMVGALDFKKAYDTVSQDWVLKSLANVGIPAKMIQRVAAVQQSAVSRVNVRGVLTRPVRLLTGVRQGCPLSPTLFVIAVDCLIRRLDRSMRGLVSHTPTPEYDLPREPYDPSIHEQVHDPGPTNTLSDAKVLAYADDIAVFMSCNNDIQVVGEALVAFQQVSGLTLSPSKTVLQLVGGTKIPLQIPAGDIFPSSAFSFRTPPDPDGPLPAPPPPAPDVYDMDHLQMSFVRDYWPRDPKTGKTPVLTPREDIFRYLGVHFGGHKARAAFYVAKREELKGDLRRLPLWGLPYYSRAWLINTFFYTRFFHLLAYVDEFDGQYLREITELACDRINERKLDDEGNLPTRRFVNGFITTPIDQGGLNLRDLQRFADSMRTVRAYRFFTRDTPALRDASFQFYSVCRAEDGVIGATGVDRLQQPLVVDNRQWSKFLSVTMERARKALSATNADVRKEILDPTVPPAPTESSTPFEVSDYHEAVHRAEVSAEMKVMHLLFQIQRSWNPVRHLSDAELDHLQWGVGYRSGKELMATWRITRPLDWLKEKGSPRKFARPLDWEEQGIFPASMDPFWSQIMGKMRAHYIKNANKAQVLHFLRVGRIKVTYADLPAEHSFKWKKKGCGLCHEEDTKRLQQHIFCSCPVMKAFMLELGTPAVETMGEWVFGEEPLCRRKTKSKKEETIEEDSKERRIRGNYYRELAFAIWKLERELRSSGEDANQSEIRVKYSFWFKRAQSCYLDIQEYENSESSQSQETEAVALWLEETGQGGGGSAGTG